MRKILKNRGGFSIFEVLIVTALFAMVLLAVVSLRGNLNVLQNLISQKLQSRADLSQTLQIFVTELRSSGPSSLGGYPVESAGTSSLVFYSDIDKDGLFERVRYTLTSSTIEKGVVRPTGNPLSYATSSETTTTVVNYVVPQASTSIFTYYDAGYTGSESALAQPVNVSDIRIVNISIYADVDPENSPQPVFFTNTVNIRNLRSN
jgi:type II secretory pathway pseudopilin PulG